MFRGIQISDLLRCLQRVTNNLENQFGNVTLYRNHDWHQHDGFINNSKVISWEEINSDLENEKTLYDSRHGDDHVRITIYSGTLEFILRYYILEEDDDAHYPGKWGDFDITIDKNNLGKVENIIRQTGFQYIVSRAKDYFDKNYAG